MAFIRASPARDLWPAAVYARPHPLNSSTICRKTAIIRLLLSYWQGIQTKKKPPALDNSGWKLYFNVTVEQAAEPGLFQLMTGPDGESEGPLLSAAARFAAGTEKEEGK
jgi:hypothetical protein